MSIEGHIIQFPPIKSFAYHAVAAWAVLFNSKIDLSRILDVSQPHAYDKIQRMPGLSEILMPNSNRRTSLIDRAEMKIWQSARSGDGDVATRQKALLKERSNPTDPQIARLPQTQKNLQIARWAFGLRPHINLNDLLEIPWPDYVPFPEDKIRRFPTKPLSEGLIPSAEVSDKVWEEQGAFVNGHSRDAMDGSLYQDAMERFYQLQQNKFQQYNQPLANR